MRATNPFDHAELAKHLSVQQKAAWDLDTCVNWSIGVDPSKILVLLDDESIAFSGVSAEQFFEEETKHAAAFKKYLNISCDCMGLCAEDLDLLWPRSFGSRFQSLIINTGKLGCRAFWWVVSNVEEVFIDIYKEIFRRRPDVDPLFYHPHRSLMEEESRHANGACLMPELMDRRQKRFARLVGSQGGFHMGSIGGDAIGGVRVA